MTIDMAERWQDEELFQQVARELERQEPQGEPESYGTPIRLYEVTEIELDIGLRVREVSCASGRYPAFWLALPEFARICELGDVFGFGWSDRETVVWPPGRLLQGEGGAETAPL